MTLSQAVDWAEKVNQGLDEIAKAGYGGTVTFRFLVRLWERHFDLLKARYAEEVWP